MSANESALKHLVESSRPAKKEDNEIISIQSYNSSVMHIEENDAAKIFTLEKALDIATQDAERLKVQAELGLVKK